MMLKKVLSIVLAVVMVLPLLSSTALGAGAEDEIEFRYDDICAEDGTVICVGQNGKWGLLDTRTGDEILPCEYENNALRDGGEGFIYYTKYVEEIGEYRSAYLDKTGKAITPFKYYESYPRKFHDGLAAVCDENYKWGFIDQTGKEVVPQIYDEVSDFYSGMAVVRMGDWWSDEATYACIDKSGNEIVPFGKYDFIISPREDSNASVVGVQIIVSDDEYKFGLIDSTGKEVIPCECEGTSLDGEGSIWDDDGLAKFHMGNEITIIDESGRIILESDKYDGYAMSYGGLLGVRRDGKWGCIDIQTGEEIIACIYDLANGCGGGYAEVELNGKHGMVDKNGKEIIPCIYDRINDFENHPYTFAYLNGEEIIIDRTGKEIMKYNNLANAFREYGLQGVHSDTGWGAVDSVGKEIVPCQYDDLALAYGYVKVRNYDDDMAGLFDSKGNEILPREYDNIIIVSETLVAVWENGKWGFLYLGDKSAAPTPTAYASTQKVLVDGKEVVFQCYALRDASGNDTNYIKLRDMAAILNGSAAQFNVNYDGNIVIETKKPYTTANGTEMNTPFSGNREYKTNTDVTKIDGVASDLAAITLTDDAGGGYTYYKLRDLGQALGFNVGWDNVKGNIFVETDKPYDPNN